MLIIYLAIAYLLSGVVFSIVFLVKLINDFDEGAVGAHWVFRLIILPGCVVLWPVLLIKLMRMRHRDHG